MMKTVPGRSCPSLVRPRFVFSAGWSLFSPGSFIAFSRALVLLMWHAVVGPLLLILAAFIAAGVAMRPWIKCAVTHVSSSCTGLMIEYTKHMCCVQVHGHGTQP